MSQFINNAIRRIGLYESRELNYIEYLVQYAKKNTVVVDVGSGNGALSKAFTSKGAEVVSIEINPMLLKRNPQLKNRVCCDAQNLPFQENSVDLVIVISLLEHLHNPTQAISEFNRALKKTGELIIQLPNMQFLIEPHTKAPLLFLMPLVVKNVLWEKMDNYYTNFKLSRKALFQILKPFFIITEEVKIHHKFTLGPWPPGWFFVAQKRLEK
jgi:ubiquinone/menaquinone biosynthesis C-methylase UbiE